MAYMRCRFFLAVKSFFSLTRNLVVAPERKLKWLRDIWTAVIYRFFLWGYRRQTRGSECRLAFNLHKVQKGRSMETKIRLRKAWHLNKCARNNGALFDSRSPWEHSYESLNMTHHLIIVFIIVVAIVFTWCVFCFFGPFLTKERVILETRVRRTRVPKSVYRL